MWSSSGLFGNPFSASICRRLSVSSGDNSGNSVCWVITHSGGSTTTQTRSLICAESR